MAIPKKGSRSISVDQAVYRWMVRRKPSCPCCGRGLLTFAVELGETPGSVLVARMPSPRLDNVMGSPLGQPVRPSLVEKVIRTALASGWRPDRPGHPFTVNVP